MTEDSRGVDVAIEAAGLPAVWETAFRQVSRRPGALLWRHEKDTTVNIDCTRMHYEQITIKGVFHTTPIHVNAAFELLKMGAIKAEDFVEHEYAIEETEAAIRNMRQERSLKTVLFTEKTGEKQWRLY